jgi:energy-coupling factor transporter ATP-binding protein EcfA2
MSHRFNVFLSHNSSDKPLVEEIANRLKAVGLEPWLDKWNLIPGDPWQPALEEALADCQSCAVFIGPSGLGTWQHEEMRAAINRRVAAHETNHRFRVIPVLLPGSVRGARSRLPEFLVATTWVEFRRRIDDDAFRVLERAIRGLPPGPNASGATIGCPYRGLEFFDVEHAPIYFGRDSLVDWLLSALRGTSSPEGPTRFVAIIGASGSGKSSLARAGLLAALKHDGLEGSLTWPVTVCRPGPRPLEALATELARTSGISLGQGLLSNLIEELRSALLVKPNTLHLTSTSSLDSVGSTRRHVVLVDQFEEVFTLCHDEGERTAFINNLLYAALIPKGQTIVIVTIRADLYGRCALHTQLSAAVAENQFLVGPMTADGIREAITRPAGKVGCQIEPGLVELLVQDVLRQPGALPLLQFGLLRIWETRRINHEITTADYVEMDGLGGILKKRAEEVFLHFTPKQQNLCRRMFLRLIEPGEPNEDTRRRAQWHELVTRDDNKADLEEVVETLASERLLTISKRADDASNATIELAHETLIRDWPRLHSWVEADRAGLRIHRRLTEDSNEWNAAMLSSASAGTAVGLLYRTPRLEAVRCYIDEHPGVLSATEKDFVEASIREQEMENWRLRRLAEMEAIEARQREFQIERLNHRKASGSSKLLGALATHLFGFDVFVSYSQIDGRFYALSLIEALQSRGIACWLDQHEIMPGTGLSIQLRSAVRRSRVMVVIASDAARASEYVRLETEAFLRLGKPIIPIVFDESGGWWDRESSLATMLAGLVWLNERREALENGPPMDTVERIVHTLRHASVRRRVRLSVALTAAAAAASVLAWLLLG